MVLHFIFQLQIIIVTFNISCDIIVLCSYYQEHKRESEHYQVHSRHWTHVAVPSDAPENIILIAAAYHYSQT
jgi:hypothetical protein